MTSISVSQSAPALVQTQNFHFSSDAEAKTFLEKCIWKGKVDEFIAALTTISFDLNTPDIHGDFLLHQAVRADRPLIVSALLDKGANPELKDSYGFTAIRHALDKKSEPIVLTILSKKLGLSENLLTDLLRQSSPAGHAQKIRDKMHYFLALLPNLVKELDSIQKDDPLYNDKTHITLVRYSCFPIHYAILTGQIETVKDLLKTVSLNVLSARGDSLLHFAAIGPSKEILKLLVEAGIDIDHQNQYGETALHYAAAVENLSHMEMLIKEGSADLDLVDKEEMSALGLFSSLPGIKASIPKTEETAEAPHKSRSCSDLCSKLIGSWIAIEVIARVALHILQIIDRISQQQSSSGNQRKKQYSGGTKGSASQGGCSQLTAGQVKKMSDKDRVLTDKLNPKCPQDAAWILSPDNDLKNGIDANEAKRQYRNLGRKFHPDKFKDPQAQQAFIKISDASDCVSAHLNGDVPEGAMCP